MDTDRNGTTYVLTDIDVQIPNRTDQDLLHIKLYMVQTPNILSVRTYSRMFPDKLLPDGMPDPNYLQATYLEFECNKSSVIQSLGWVNLDIALPGKELINSWFFLSKHHDQVLIGPPSCDRLGAYTLHLKNLAPPFDQTKLLPQLCKISHMGTEHNPIDDVTYLIKTYPKQFNIIGSFEGEYYMIINLNIPPVQHAMRKTPRDYQEKIEQEVDKMIQPGIITHITELTEWVNSSHTP